MTIRSTLIATCAVVALGAAAFLAGNSEETTAAGLAAVVDPPAKPSALGHPVPQNRTRLGVRGAPRADPIHGALATLSHALGADRSAASGAQGLAGALRLDPSLAAALHEALVRGSVPLGQRAALFLAFELAATRETTATLSTMVLDGRLTVVDRARAASAMADSVASSSASLTALDAASHATRDAARSAATLAIGTLEARARARGDVDLGAEARRTLQARLNGPADAPERRELLTAVGNSGNPALLADVAPWLQDTDATVRLAAVQAVRRMPVGSTATLFGPLISTERGAGIRAALADTWREQAVLAGSAPPAAVLLAAARALVVETEPRTRLALVQLLGAGSSGDDGARDALSAQLAVESSPSVATAIGRYLIPPGALP